MTQIWIQFLCFHRTEKYMQYLRCNNVKQQEASDGYLFMTATEFFGLDSKKGRTLALRNLLGLVKFFEQQQESQEKEKGLNNESVNQQRNKSATDGLSGHDLDGSRKEDSPKQIKGRNVTHRKRKRESSAGC